MGGERGGGCGGGGDGGGGRGGVVWGVAVFWRLSLADVRFSEAVWRPAGLGLP